jgi:hypothetical protein
MAYVLKNTEGNIIAASPSENPGQGWEQIEDDPKDYIHFLETSLAKSAPFRESDIQLVRVLEDVISLLIERSLIRFTDLPLTAQKRLNDRESMRKKTNLTGLVDDVGDDLIY